MTPSPPFHDLTQTETGLIRTLMLLCSENSHRMHNWQKWQRAINTMYNSYVNVQERSKGDSNHWNRLCGECSRSRTRRKRQREDTRRIIIMCDNMTGAVVTRRVSGAIANSRVKRTSVLTDHYNVLIWPIVSTLFLFRISDTDNENSNSSVPSSPLVRHPTTALPLSDKTPTFVINAANKTYKHQYANIYFARLRILREFVQNEAQKRWKDVAGKPQTPTALLVNVVYMPDISEHRSQGLQSSFIEC